MAIVFYLHGVSDGSLAHFHSAHDGTDPWFHVLVPDAAVGAPWTPIELDYSEKAVWWQADETADALEKLNPTDTHYKLWHDTYWGYTLTGAGTEGQDAGPIEGSINGIRACFYSDANGGDDQSGPVVADDVAIKSIFTSASAGFIAAIWRKDSADANTTTQRTIVYWSVESPGNGNNQRFGIAAHSGTVANGVRAQIRQDYLDGQAAVDSDTNYGAEVVIAVVTADWTTGDVHLYVNGTLTETQSIPNFAGASDASVSLKMFVGTTDNGNIQSNAHAGEVLALGNFSLTEADRQRVEGYLAWKWQGDSSNTDTVALLPLDHPYKEARPLIEE